MPRGRSLYDEAALQGRLWTPTIVPSVELWLDAADLSTISCDANGVTQWRDKSGKGRHATPESGRNPTLIHNVQNGLPVLFFDGTDDGMIGSYPITVPSETIFIAFNRLSTSLGGTVTRYFTHSDSADFDYVTTNGVVPAVRYVDNLITVKVVNTGWMTGVSYSTGPVIYEFAFGTNGIEVIKNGVIADTNGWNGSKTFTRYGIGVTSVCGAYGSETLYSNYFELLVLSVYANSLFRSKVEGYLAWKWGMTDNLPATHAFRNRPPLRDD